MSADARHRLGSAGERLACEHLDRRGYRILERNFRTRWGELDVVALDGSTLVFCEVKTRRLPLGGGTPLEAVHGRKQAQLRRMARGWLMLNEHRPYASLLRFDAIGVTLDETGRLLRLEHVEDAF